jgi:hypothetical protein
MKKIYILAIALALNTNYVLADDLKSMLTKVEQLSAEGNYSKALEELNWAKKDIEQNYLKKLTSFLPDTLNGLQGAKPESNSAMGFTNVSRQYTEGANSVKIEIQGGSAGGAQAGLGGLAALGQMAAMLGNGQNGQATMRINGRTATLNEENGELTIFLEGGSMLTIHKTSGTADLKAVAEGIKIDDIEKYIKGTK